MSTPRWNDPAEDAANPHRPEERAAVRRELEARLDERRILLSGDETDEQIVRMIDAVERFEQAVARVGGDSMVNAPESSQPDDPRLVVPPRRADESADSYIDRVRDAADGL